MFEKDDILVPRETSWFGYFPDGSFDTVLPAQETTLYTEDWIGLKTLDEAGKVKFISVPGSSQNPGVVTVTGAVFGSKPDISGDILAKAFQVDKSVVDQLQATF